MCIINLCLFRKIKLMELIDYSTTNFFNNWRILFISFCRFENWIINFQIDEKLAKIIIFSVILPYVLNKIFYY